MFQEKAQAFLALPVNEAASADLSGQISAALSEQGIEPIAATDMNTDGVLSDQVHSAIRRAEFVVADLTGANPNVLFEVGLALGLSKPVLLLSQAPATEMPFDLRTQQVAMYRPDDLTAVRRYVELWLRDVRARRQTAAY
jgi:hypothetical protein